MRAERLGSMIKYLLSTYCVPSPELGPGSTHNKDQIDAATPSQYSPPRPSLPPYTELRLTRSFSIFYRQIWYLDNMHSHMHTSW